MENCGGLRPVAVELAGKGEYREGTSTLELKGEFKTTQDKVSLLKEDDKWKLDPEK